MSRPTIDALRAEILEIEARIDDGSYKPGPWARMLKRAHLLEPHEREPIAEDVTRVSNKLHRFNRPGRVASVRTGVILGLVVFFGGIADIFWGVWLDNRFSTFVVFASAFAACGAAQPLFKILVGYLLGVRYSYVWVWARIEPRVKMQYGTYLTLPFGRRLILHAAGTVGSVAVFLTTGYTLSALGIMPQAATMCIGMAWFFVGLNSLWFVTGLLGHRWSHRMMSAGVAAFEILQRRELARQAASPADA